MTELLIELQPIIYQAAVVVITAFGTYLGSKAKQYVDYNRMVDVVQKTVEYVEELGYRNELLKGEEKFLLAKEKSFEWLSARNIPFTEVELEILINALVKEMRDKEKEGE